MPLRIQRAKNAPTARIHHPTLPRLSHGENRWPRRSNIAYEGSSPLNSPKVSLAVSVPIVALAAWLVLYQKLDD